MHYLKPKIVCVVDFDDVFYVFFFFFFFWGGGGELIS